MNTKLNNKQSGAVFAPKNETGNIDRDLQSKGFMTGTYQSKKSDDSRMFCLLKFNEDKTEAQVVVLDEDDNEVIRGKFTENTSKMSNKSPDYTGTMGKVPSVIFTRKLQDKTLSKKDRKYYQIVKRKAVTFRNIPAKFTS